MENKLKVLLTTILLFVAALSCDERKYLPTPPTEPPKPPGYQEDIPWPSLADSPWPMNHHDPQSTGRSNYQGPVMGELLWSYQTNFLQSSLVLGADSLIYAASFDTTSELSAINIIGQNLWNTALTGQGNEIQSTPLTSANGITYVALGLGGEVYAVDPNGNIRWVYDHEYSIWLKGFNIDLEGNLYFTDSNNQLNVLSPEGKILWQFHHSAINYTSGTSLTFSPDGKTIYIPGTGPSLIAVSMESHSVEWTLGELRFDQAPIVDSKGNIYISTELTGRTNGLPALFSITPNGDVRWIYKHNNVNLQKFGGDPTIDKYGNIYIAYDTLYSINYDGKLNWKKSLEYVSGSPLISDNEGNIYVCATNWSSGALLKVDNEGATVWEVNFSFPDYLPFSPIINENSEIYLPMWQSNSIYAIK